MFELALRAKLPLIKVQTGDILNYMDIIRYYVGDSNVIQIQGVKDLQKDFSYFVWYAPKMLAIKSVYTSLMNSGQTIIIVNPEQKHSLMFDGGTLGTPKKLIAKELQVAGFEDRQIQSLLSVLSGLNLIQVGEICRLAMAEFGELSASGINSIKMAISAPVGLLGLDTKQDFYLPNQNLKNFVTREAWFFNVCDDPRLRSRGLLLYGMAGSGKSQAAKYIARQWKVPLYLLDLSSIIDKFIGESEGNMQATLSKIDKEAPCVLLLDEIEKLFQSESSGTVSRLLSLLLWWLQEHTSRVFTVMTSNNIKVLPVELYRVGRIDRVEKFGGLGKKAAYNFVSQCLGKYDLPENTDKEGCIQQIIKRVYNTGINPESQAKLVGETINKVKEIIV